MKKSAKKCGRLPPTSDSMITCSHPLTLWYCVYTCSDVRLLVHKCHIRCSALCCNVTNSVLQCVAVCCSVSLCGHIWNPPKDGEIALWPSTNGVIPYFLVLPGSELSITEITEHTYFSLLKPCREFMYKSE